jgi:hypothetical protein
MFSRFITTAGCAWIAVYLLTACSKQSSTSVEGVASVASVRPKPEQIWFEEVAAKAGIDFHYQSGHRPGRFYIPEIMGGGVGLLDYNNDGLLDVYCVQGGSLYPDAKPKPGNKLFRNVGGWRFEDMTDKAGLAGHGEYGMGCACGDYNGDGWMDIYVTNLGRNTLYRNNGDGTFTDTTDQAGVAGNSWSTSAAFFDFDHDGNLDLVTANYIKWSLDREIQCFSRGGKPDYCSPMDYKAPAMATLYHNRGDGTFEDVSVAAGLDKVYGNGLGVAIGDFDHNGWLDIYVANDAMPNQLWLNQGNGTFKDEAMFRGCAVSALGVPEAGMGVVAVDLMQRGGLDLFITHLVGEANRLYLNTNDFFLDWVQPKGPGATSWPFTGFGVGFFDFNRDGLLDLYVANGRVKLGATDFDPADPYAEPNQLLKGLNLGEFEEMPNAGLASPLVATSRGCAFGDLDNDGSIDIVVINHDGPAHVLRNVTRSTEGHWVMFRAQARAGIDARNSVLRIQAGSSVQWRQGTPNEGYCSSNDPRIHFGIGSATRIDSLTIYWKKGDEEVFGPFAADATYTVLRGTGRKPD